MSTVEPIGPWLPATLVMVAVLSLLELALGRGTVAQERVEKIRSRKPLATTREEKKVSPERRLLTAAGKLLVPLRLTGALENELAGADVPLRAEEFLGSMVFAALGGGLVGLFLCRSFLGGLVFAVVGGALPLLILVRARTSRLVRFNNRLPDALLLMASGLRAGFPFVQTLEMVDKEIPGPVGREFGQTFRQIQLGSPTDEALADLAVRVRSTELDLVVTAVLIQREVGGNLAEVLDNIAATLRDRLRIKSEIRAVTAAGRMSGWIIGLLPVVVAALILVLNPGYFSVMLETFGGQVALGVAVLGEIIGALIIRRIVALGL
ncbi:MAG: type II secretion system F family protein [Bacillota bacterium]